MQCHDQSTDHIVDSRAQATTGDYGRRSVLGIKKEVLSWTSLFQTHWFLIICQALIKVGNGGVEYQPIPITYKIKDVVSLNRTQL
jgi:hypothetical protein